MERSKPPLPRLFLDSGVFLEGVLAPWSVPRFSISHRVNEMSGPFALSPFRLFAFFPSSLPYRRVDHNPPYYCGI
jgi:hypothetical protein